MLREAASSDGPTGLEWSRGRAVSFLRATLRGAAIAHAQEVRVALIGARDHESSSCRSAVC